MRLDILSDFIFGERHVIEAKRERMHGLVNLPGSPIPILVRVVEHARYTRRKRLPELATRDVRMRVVFDEPLRLFDDPIWDAYVLCAFDAGAGCADVECALARCAAVILHVTAPGTSEIRNMLRRIGVAFDPPSDPPDFADPNPRLSFAYDPPDIVG